jgi:peroxiredoxin
MGKEGRSAESYRSARRIPWPILIFALGGVGLSIAFIVLSYPQTAPPRNGNAASAVDSLQQSITSDAVLVTPGLSNQLRFGDPRVGQPAPDFTLKTLDGDTVSLSDFSGRPVLINFWATWCAPCWQEMPELVRAYNTHEAQGFVVLAVNLTHQDLVEEVQTFVEEFDMIFPVLLDEDGNVSGRLYRVPGLPMSVFIDRDGVIRWRHIGLMTSEQIDEFVGEILQ